LNSPPLSFFFMPSPLIPGIVSTITFSICIHSYTVFALYSPSHPFSPPPPPSRQYQTSPQKNLFSSFVKEKKWYFCLLKIVTQGVFLWHFPLYMYYFIFFSAVLEFELKALCLLGRLSTTWATFPDLFALGIFQIRSCVYVPWIMVLPVQLG
jgi:hypothetical protein